MARILLVLEGSHNRRQLHTWLAQYHSVAISENLAGESYDLCVVDGPGLRKFKEQIEARRSQEQPGILPVLLLTTRPGVWSRSPDLWHYVDDAVTLPASKTELQARVEILLRARRLSLELKLRNEDLEAFIQAVSHDLRGSVRAITMFVDALEAKSQRLPELFDDESRQDLQRIHWAAAEMRDLIDSLLSFSRLGRGEIRQRPIDLREYIQTCVESLADIQQRQAQVRIKARKGTVHADPTLLKLALTNLLSNAVKFVPEGTRPEVTVSASIRKDICRIQIDDNGAGIRTEDQQRIFLPFVRLHSEEEVPGIGLGLPSVRKALELMGGRVGVSSKQGSGSSFWIEFPSAA